MMREFEEYRPYTSIGQFRGEIGKYVSPEEVAAFETYLFVPVDPEQADADTLQQLPGVTADIANTLISGRPYGSAQAFIDALPGIDVRAGLAFFSGMTLPLAFFPSWLESFARVLPFASIIQVPIDVYLGKHTGANLAAVLAVQAAWAVALLTIGRIALARGTRKLVVQGG
jgi:hypothetical protein